MWVWTALCAVESGTGPAAAADGLVVAEVGGRRTSTLFIVPWLQAARPRAFSSVSTSRWQVSTLPPTMAGASAGSSGNGGFSRPSGIDEGDRAHQALVQGQGLVDEQPKDVENDAAHDGGGRVQVARVHPAGPGEVDPGAVVREVDPHSERGPVVEALLRLVASLRGDASGRRPRSVRPAPPGRPSSAGPSLPRGAHTGRAGRSPRGGWRPPRRGDRPGCLRGLRLGYGASASSRRTASQRASPSRTRCIGGRMTPSSTRRVADGRHRAGPHAADLGVVGAAGQVSQELSGLRVRRRHDRHVGEVRAPEARGGWSRPRPRASSRSPREAAGRTGRGSRGVRGCGARSRRARPPGRATRRRSRGVP